jgi:hypothetical protein
MASRDSRRTRRRCRINRLSLEQRIGLLVYNGFMDTRIPTYLPTYPRRKMNRCLDHAMTQRSVQSFTGTCGGVTVLPATLDRSHSHNALARPRDSGAPKRFAGSSTDSRKSSPTGPPADGMHSSHRGRGQRTPELRPLPSFENSRSGRSPSVSSNARSSDVLPIAHETGSSIGGRFRSRLTPGPLASSQKEHPWSLFGQVMGDQGQLASPGAPAAVRNPPRKPSLIGLNLVQTTSPEAVPQSISDSPLLIGRSAEVQSPVYDPFLEAHEYFPATASQSIGRPGTSTGYDSDDSTSSEEQVYAVPVKADSGRSLWHMPQIPTLHRNILKCAIAYFIGSLFTFSPYLSSLIADITSYGIGQRGPSASGHMVATV